MEYLESVLFIVGRISKNYAEQLGGNKYLLITELQYAFHNPRSIHTCNLRT